MNKARLIAISSVVLLIAGCTADDTLTSQKDTGQALVFDATAEASDPTRGLVVKEADLQANGFKLYANTVKNNVATPLMEGTAIKYTGGSWTYAPIVYWPTEGKVDFFPVYTDDNATCIYGYDKRPHVTYTVPTDVSDQTDFLWAAPILNSDYKSEGFKFSFQHALASIAVEITSDYDGFVEALQDPTNFAGNIDPTISSVFATPAGETPATLADFTDRQLVSVEITGKFPAKAEIDPKATSIDKAWVFEYNDPSLYAERSYRLTSSMLNETDNSATVKVAKSDPESYIFVLPSGTTNFNVKLTYKFKYKNLLYLYTLSTTGNENFKAGKQVNLKSTVQCKKAPETLQKVSIS